MDNDDMEMDSQEKPAQQNGVAEALCSYDTPSYPVLPAIEMDDWQYVMRRTMQEIIPGLYLGPYAAAAKSKMQELKDSGISHIVCVREFRERNLIRPNHPDDFQYLVVEVEDSSMANIIPHFRTVNPFIKFALNNGGKVLVHGSAGISRSVALVIAYIMETYGVTTQEAHKYVQSIRFCSNPNEGFMHQLREYEPIYRAMHVVPRALPSTLPTQKSCKRSLDEDEDYHKGPNKGGKF
ncbi:Serine/threonine/tyrosine-interacting protein B [Folsomia candida]|uniref:Serine/threonine/tyrosine-interacting protein B n=1 Tax=Folsomia candida TaxID=158441 RepID=A0A226E8C2_FOLCA|nr:Serine/threonine/tyrosine-interacting protein B [Folsomia candida]